MTLQLAISASQRSTLQSATANWTPTRAENGVEASFAPVMHYDQDREIYGEGDGAEYYYKVVSGMVRTCKFFADGRRQIDGFHVAGDLFGIETGREHSLSAEAVNDCSVIAIRRGNADNSGSMHLLAELMRILRRAQEHTVLLGRRSAVEKVAAFLLTLPCVAGAKDKIALAMTRQDIGDYLGLTLETVSRTISQLERDDIIELPSARQIKIKDRDALIELRG